MAFNPLENLVNGLGGPFTFIGFGVNSQGIEAIGDLGVSETFTS